MKPRLSQWLSTIFMWVMLAALGTGLLVMLRSQALTNTNASPPSSANTVSLETSMPAPEATVVLTPPASTATPGAVTAPPPTVRAATPVPTSALDQITLVPSATPLPTASGNGSPYSSQKIQFTPATELNSRIRAAFGDAAWSPDSQMLALSTSTGRMLASGGWPATDITLLSANGQVVQRLVSGFNPVWSPDGKQIAYLEYSENQNELAIRIVDVTGQQVTTVATILRGGVFPILAWLSDAELLYSQDTVVLFDYQTGQERNLLDLVTPEWPVTTTRPLQFLATNPAQNLVAVASGEVLVILERRFDGFHLLKQFEGVDNPSLAFAPDASALAYVSGPTQQLRIVSIHGSGPVVELPPASRSGAWALAWSPDGASLLYANADGVHLVNRDGSGLRKLEGVPEGTHRLAWMPRGRAVILGVAQADASFTFFKLPVLTAE